LQRRTNREVAVLLVGTTKSLWDLDRSYAIAEDARVSALAAGAGSSWALLDGARIELVGAFDLDPVAALDRPDGQCLAALPSGDLVVGRTGARLALRRAAAGSTLQAIEAFESLPGRDQWENPAADSPDLRSLAVDAEGRLYANVHVGGLWMSDDSGSHWTASIEPDADVHEVTTGTGGRVAVAAAGGFGWSDDRGATWRWTAEGLHAPYCRAVSLDGDAAYVTASTGPSTTQAALYRSTRPGEPFVKCERGLPQWFPANLDTASLTTKGGVVAFGTRHGDVWQSRDGGETFEKIAFELDPVTAVLFV
jgi:hypothetical protein